MSRSVRSIDCCALLAALLFAATTSAAEPGLIYKFKVGDETKYVLKQSMKMEMTTPQIPNPVASNMTQIMSFKTVVDEVTPEGAAKQRQTITRIQMTVKSDAPGAPSLEYDSAAEEEPTGPLAGVMLQSIKPLVGAEFLQTISARGEISEVVVPESVTAALKKNPGAAAMGDAFSADGIKQISSQAAISFPEKPLTVGDKWDQKIEMKLPFGKLITTKTTTYAGSGDNGMERLGVALKVDSEPAPNAAASLKVTAGKGDGEILFDKAKGRVHSSTLKQTMAMEIAVAGQTIVQKTETDVKLQLDEGRATR